MLFGREGADQCLETLRERLADKRRTDGDDAKAISWSTDLDDVQAADLVVVAVNAAEPILFPRHIAGDRPVVIADISEPTATSEGVADERPKTHFTEGALVDLPRDRGFQLTVDVPAGKLFACAAEALLMGRSDVDLKLTGDLQAHAVRELYELGREWELF